jgi:hypothetical protein
MTTGLGILVAGLAVNTQYMIVPPARWQAINNALVFSAVEPVTEITVLDLQITFEVKTILDC